MREAPGDDPLHDVLLSWGIAGMKYGGLPDALRKAMAKRGEDVRSTAALVWDHGEVNESVGRKLEVMRRTLSGLLDRGVITEFATVATSQDTMWRITGDDVQDVVVGLCDVADELDMDLKVEVRA